MLCLEEVAIKGVGFAPALFRLTDQLHAAGRSLVFRMAARFTDPAKLERSKYDDAHLDGIFPRDPTLKDFLASGLGAGLLSCAPRVISWSDKDAAEPSFGWALIVM